VDVMDSLHPGRSFYLEDKKMSKKVSKTFKLMILILFILLITVTVVYGAC
jgi:hypothetical protein